MTRRGWLRLMAAGVLVVWLCLFLHWDNTEKSMIRALLVETNGDSWTVGLLYQFPEASADSSEAKAAIRLCIGRGPELSSAISAAEEALPQRADWRLCEYLLAGQDSVRQTLPACEELFLHRPYGRLASATISPERAWPSVTKVTVPPSVPQSVFVSGSLLLGAEALRRRPEAWLRATPFRVMRAEVLQTKKRGPVLDLEVRDPPVMVKVPAPVAASPELLW